VARPKSDDKREAILAAATRIFAERGLDAAPTSAISAAAGVAQGTLFTYFATKDDLLNALYRALKLAVAADMMAGLPRRTDARALLRHLWNRYVDWGVSHPEQRKVLAQLQVSDRITPASKAAGARPFADFDAVARASVARREVRRAALPVMGPAMGALAEMTMDLMAAHPAAARRYRTAGFDVLWNGIAAK
jgi:AcrR family transcriptional regulator